jgi:uncharacterized protein DUF3147
MKIRFDPQPMRESGWSGHVLRFLIGGTVTALTGLFVKAVGPRAGGLLLALPSIFPVGLAMTVKREDKKVGESTRGDRGRRAAVIESVGASAGCGGLAAFALMAWLLLPRMHPALALAVATVAWCAVATGIWLLRKAAR